MSMPEATFSQASSQLVARSKAGDREAFAKLYDEYFAVIYRFVFLKLRHKETSEDIAQNVFLKALSAIETFEERGLPFSSWLYKIARNLCLDYFKKKSDVVVAEPEIFFPNIADEKMTAEESFDLQERVGRLLRAIDSLSDEQKEIVIMRFVQELSYEEISKILDKSEESLRAQNYRAMKKLKIILKEHGETGLG